MAGNAKYCKKTKIVISRYTLQQRADDRALDKMVIIGRMKGYADSELEELKKQDGLLSGSAKFIMPAISAGSFVAFNFGNDMWMQTINPGGERSGTTSANGDSTYKMGADSQASLFTNDSYGFGDFQDEDMKDDDMSDMEIAMPEGGLKDMDTEEAGNQENGSAASAMSPMDLNTKFDDGKGLTTTNPPLEDDLEAWEQDRRNRVSAHAASCYQARMDDEREDSEWEQGEG